ncbi:MAG: hypothetical protein ACE5RC_03935 [Nitrosopumilus sp.]
MNIDRYEVFKCIEEVIGKDNLVVDPEISGRNIMIRIKKDSQINILEYEKRIADNIANFVNSPFGVIITES